GHHHPAGRAERGRRPRSRRPRLRHGGRARRHGRPDRRVARQRRHPGILPRQIGRGDPRREALEEAQDLEMTAMQHVRLETPAVTIDGCDTLARLFIDRVEKWGDRTALREKNFGVWESYSWRDFDRHARAYAAGLVALGMKSGDVV